MTVKCSLGNLELTHESPTDWVRVKMVMPGWLDCKPELGAMEREQFFARIIQREQSIGPLKRYPRGIQYGVQLKIIPCIRLELLRNNSAPVFSFQDHPPSY
jgi:hypothetical protein